MIPNSGLLGYGAPLNSAFRSLGPSILNKNQRQAAPTAPKPPELNSLTKNIYGNKELAALARYFNSYQG